MVNPFSNLEDSELMLKYQDGDHMAFEVLYMRHKNLVYSYIAKRLHKTDDIEDLFQRIFTKLHKSRSLYNPKFEFLPWLYTISRCEFLDFIKKKKITSAEFDENIHTRTDSNDSESMDIQSESDLTQKEKDAIELRYIKDNDFLEISSILNTSESNARKLISRGIKKLKNKYAGVKS